MNATDISAGAKRAIFEAMVSVAWADAQLQREEVLAVVAAAEHLGLATTPEAVYARLDRGAAAVAELEVDGLSLEERRLLYLCAAWVASVDDKELDSETAYLDRLQEMLDLDADRAAELHRAAQRLHEDGPKALTWWQELEALFSAAAGLLET